LESNSKLFDLQAVSCLTPEPEPRGEMTLSLSDKDQAMLHGDYGPATKMAMSIIVRMAEVSGAKELLDITSAHIDSTVYIGDAGLEFAEKLASLSAKVSVPTTLNVSGLDEYHWQEWAVPNDWARQAHRQMVAYQSMGTVPTWTCAPYQTEMKPSFGQQIAWGESNAIVFANSVLGARTERYPDMFDICCAITGRAPAIGLHLTENRAGNLLLQLDNISEALQYSDDFYPVLGHLVGKVALDKIPVIAGMKVRPNEDQLKALGAAAASSGGVALFHMVGVTPEAQTLESAFQGKHPQQTIIATMAMLRESRRALTHTDSEKLDMVVLGSPHFSLAEFKQLAPLVAGKQKHADVKFLVTSSRAMTQLAKQAGFLDALQAFGAQLTVDTCILTSPMLPSETKYLMTNSAKFAYYAPGLLSKQITFGSLKDCVASAIEGRVIRDETLWMS
jgi:predicted aconitase